MTDLKDRLTLLLAGEPAAPDDLGAILRQGRGARRRRSVATGAAAFAGTAALVTSVAVPVSLADGSGGTTKAIVASRPPAPAPTHIGKSCTKWQKVKKNRKGEYYVVTRKHHGKVTIYTCRAVKPHPRPSS